MPSFLAMMCAATLCGLAPQQAIVSPAPTAIVRGQPAWTATPLPTLRLVEKGFPNFGRLNNAVWRSGQPKKEGYTRLSEIGVKTVVNLQQENPQEKERLPAGVNYIYIPIPDQHEPTEAQARQFLDVVANPANWPVLVHCHGGEGRAGVMSALVRYSFDGWDDKRIMQEVNNFRIPYLNLFKTKLDDRQRRFLVQWQADNVPGAYQQKIRP